MVIGKPSLSVGDIFKVEGKTVSYREQQVAYLSADTKGKT